MRLSYLILSYLKTGENEFKYEKYETLDERSVGGL